MSNSIKVSYTRAVTTKHEDGGFDKAELGGVLDLELGDDADLEAATSAYNAVFDALREQVDTKLEALVPVAPVATNGNGAQAAVTEEKPAEGGNLAKWVKTTVDKNTDDIRSRVQGSAAPAKAIPGEKFAKGPPSGKEAPKVTTADITEREAVAFDGVKVFHDNSQTKLGKTARGTKYGMLRLGKRGEIPGDYVTGKSFDPEVVPQIEAILEGEIQNVDVYGYFEARNNDPDAFDLVIQGVAQAS